MNDHCCMWCGTTVDLQGHHIIYRSHSGIDDASNIITLCERHHRKAQSDRQFMMRVLESLRGTEYWRWEDSYQALKRGLRDEKTDIFRDSSG